MEKDKDTSPPADTADTQANAAAPAEGGAPAAGAEGAGQTAAASPAPKKPVLSDEERLRKQQEREERLRKWREEEDEKRNPQSGGAKFLRQVDQFIQGLREQLLSSGKDGEGEQEEEDPAVIAAKAARRKRMMIFSAIGVVVIALLAVIAPLAPLQIKRTSGFAAFQEGDYAKALGNLQEYLIDRPQDYDALYVAAQAAMFSGDVGFAEQSISDVYLAGTLSDSAVGYYYALFNFRDTEQALRAVEQALAHDPQHLAARLLRGILLGRDVSKAREAREDFLQAGEIIRRGGSDTALEDIRSMYRRIQSRGYLSLGLTLPDFGGNIHSDVSRQLGFSPRLDGFVLAMQYSKAAHADEEILSPDGIINYFFMDMLLRHNELQEAGTVLEGLQSDATDSMVVTQMAGFYAAARGDYAEAKAQFEKILAQLPHDPTTINNFATVELLSIADDVTDPLNRAIGLYKRLLELEEADVLELGNGAYLALLGGDRAVARNLLEKASLESTADSGILPAPARLTRAMLQMVEGDSEAAAAELATISESDLPGVSRYLLAVYENSGNTEAALTILEQLAGVFSAGGAVRGTGHFYEYIRLLCAEGEWALALIYLQEYLRASPGGASAAQEYDVRYLLGLTALQFTDVELLEAQRQVLGRLPQQQDAAQHYSYALEAAIAARAGDVSFAAENYLKAIATVEDSRLRYAYLMAWAQVQVEENPREVAAALRGYLEEYDLPGIKSLLAYALVETDAEEAVRLAQDDVARNSHAYLVNLYAGAALTRAGQFVDGLELLIAANMQRPAQRKVLDYLKKAYLGAGEQKRAEETAATLDYLAALARGEADEVNVSYKIHLPENEDIVKQVQDMVRGSGNYGDVQQAYGLALGAERNTKKRAEILYSKATFEAYNKTYEKAAGLFSRAVGMGLPRHEMQVQALLFYYQVLQLTERYQEAQQVVERLIAVDGEKLLYRRMRAKVLVDEGRERDALKAYLSLLVDYPTDLQSYYQAADLHMVLEEPGEALLLLRRLLFVAPPSDARAYELLAKVHRILGETEKSVQYSNAFSLLEGMQRGG